MLGVHLLEWVKHALDFRCPLILIVAPPPQPHDWYQSLKDFSAPLIAIVALIVTAYFAWRQWQTAHEQWKIAQQRVVLDLFERRMGIYEDLRTAIAKVNASGNTTEDVVFEFLKAKERVRFLFGKEIQDYVENLYKSLVRHLEHCTMIPETNGDERKKHIAAKMQGWQEIVAFYSEFPLLIAPYVQMHTKVP
jgi:hypothetical protein